MVSPLPYLPLLSRWSVQPYPQSIIHQIYIIIKASYWPSPQHYNTAFFINNISTDSVSTNIYGNWFTVQVVECVYTLLVPPGYYAHQSSSGGASQTEKKHLPLIRWFQGEDDVTSVTNKMLFTYHTYLSCLYDLLKL